MREPRRPDGRTVFDYVLTDKHGRSPFEQLLQDGYFTCTCGGRVLIGGWTEEDLIKGATLECRVHDCLYWIQNREVIDRTIPGPIRFQATPY